MGNFKQVLKDKRIHVFGELLAVPSVQAVWIWRLFLNLL